ETEFVVVLGFDPILRIAEAAIQLQTGDPIGEIILHVAIAGCASCLSVLDNGTRQNPESNIVEVKGFGRMLEVPIGADSPGQAAVEAFARDAELFTVLLLGKIGQAGARGAQDAAAINEVTLATPEI